MAYPLKMLLQPDGHLTSTDILHTVAGAIIFDIYENQDVRLVSLRFRKLCFGRFLDRPMVVRAFARSRTGTTPGGRAGEILSQRSSPPSERF